jgi:chromosome segregation ATPase
MQPWQQQQNLSASTSPMATSAPFGSTTTGASKKTTQVIERLTSENERLRRELKAERALREECQQQERATRALANSKEDKISTLTYQLEASESAQSRKDRRMDDLKLHSKTLAEQKKIAEDSAAGSARRLDEVMAETNKKVAEAQVIAKRSEIAYDTLSKEYFSMRDKADDLDKVFKTLRTSWDSKFRDQAQRLEKLEILLDQTRQAEERMKSVNDEQGRKIEGFKEETQVFRDTHDEMLKTVQQMKWVLGLHNARTTIQETKSVDGQGTGVQAGE